MTRYLASRLLWLPVELIGISLITFALAYLVPADPARLYAGPHATLATLYNIRHQLGLDQPPWVQYLLYLWNLLHLDLGTSYELHMPVLQAILQRVPATAELAVAGVFFEVLIGVPIGLLAALAPRGLADRLGMFVTLVGISTPSFVLCYALIYLVWFKLGLFESGGYGDPLPLYLFLPAFALGLSGGFLRAAAARQPARHPLHRLHPHRPRQGALRGRATAAARAAQLLQRVADPAGAGHRLLPVRRAAG